MCCCRKIFNNIVILCNLFIAGVLIFFIAYNAISFNGKLLTVTRLHTFDKTAKIVIISICLDFFFVFLRSTVKSKSLLVTYATIFIAAFILEATIGLWAFIKINQANSSLRKDLQIMVRKYGKDKTLTLLIDTIQIENKCCGVDGPRDYKPYLKDYPKSCAVQKNVAVNKGCLNAEKEYVENLSVYFEWVARGFVVLKMFVGVNFMQQFDKLKRGTAR